MSSNSIRGKLTLGAAALVVLGLGGSIAVSQSVNTDADVAAIEATERARTLDDQLKQYILASRYGMLRRYDPDRGDDRRRSRPKRARSDPRLR